MHPFTADHVHFGFGLKPKVNARLQTAAGSVSRRAESLDALNRARRCAPDQLGANVIRDMLRSLEISDE